MNDLDARQRNYLSTREAAKIADVCEMTIRNWLYKYRLGVRIGGPRGRLRIDPQKLDEFLRTGQAPVAEAEPKPTAA